MRYELTDYEWAAITDAAEQAALGALRRQLGLGCHGGPSLWQNTIEYKWLGAGDALDGCVCLKSCRLTGGFGPGGCGLDDFKKRDAAAMSGNTLPKGDPSGIAQR